VIVNTDRCPTEKPLRRDAERNKQRIMAAARELFAKRGLEVTMDDIADHAGVGVGTVYRRFPDRELLIDALFEESLESVLALAEEGLEMKDPWEGFVHFFAGALEMQAANHALKGLLFSTAHGRERVAESRARISPVASQLAARAQASGDLRPDVTDSDMTVLSLGLGTTDDFAGQVEPEIWRRYLGIVLDGLRTSRKAPSKLDVEPIADAELDQAMRTWRPSSRRG
jgi:AcrR family transcriptional regulator